MNADERRRRVLLACVAVAQADASEALARDDAGEWLRLCDLSDRIYADAGGTIAAWRSMQAWLGKA